MAPRIVLACATVLGISLCAGARVETQTSSGTQDVGFALLNEVRALRTTIEMVASAGTSGQLVLGRLQLQEQRLNAVIARLEATRERLANAQREAAQEQDRAETLEAVLKESPAVFTANHREHMSNREDIEEMLKWHRKQIAGSAAEIQRLTAEEATLSSEVAMEQSRWSDLNRRLEEIEASLPRKRS
jgi:hypothetical protein